MKDERGPWYLLTGLVLGAALGLIYAWAIRPVQYTNTSPASLRADFKDQYRALIAMAYMANGDLVRAKARLALLQDPDPYRVLAEQAQQTLAERNSQEARALGLLAVALGQTPPTIAASSQITGTVPLTETEISLSPVISSTATALPSLTSTITLTGTVSAITPTLGTPTPTPGQTLTPTPTMTPLPTRTPTPTPGAPFVLKNQEQVCDPNLAGPLIQVTAADAAGQPVSGVEIVVTWEGGENQFYTGVKTELGLGYADFSMTPGVSYTLRLADGGQPIPAISAPECENKNGERYWGSWLLKFVQP